MTFDGATLVAGAVVVCGLIAAAWLKRGGQVGAQTRRTNAELHGHSCTKALNHVAQAEELASLIRQADDRIMELRSLCRALALSNDASPGQGTIEDAPSGQSVAAIGCPPIDRDTRTEHDHAPPRHVSKHGDPLADRVVELSSRGKTPVQIAAELHEHTGKIELILALSRINAPSRV